jgi:ribosome-associated protein
MAVIPREFIQVNSRLAIPLEDVELRISRSSGPGGQHAQKTETRVEAVFDGRAQPCFPSGRRSGS